MDPPKPTGEYAVGTITYTVKNVREESLAPGTMRSVAARVYYPVTKDSVAGLPQTRYMTRKTVEGLRRAFHLPLNFDKLEASGVNVSESYEDAPITAGKKFPLIMFNHGLCSYREGNSFLCIELVSHGYVVISVAHPLEASSVEFDDGTCIFFDKSISRKAHSPALKAIPAMKKFSKMTGDEKEIASEFDQLQRKYSGFMMARIDEWVKDTQAALGYAKDNLSSMIDFEKGIGAAGLSFGGNTAYRLCVRDPEFLCGVNIDGGIFGDYTDDILAKPFLQISCRENENGAARVCLRHTKPVYKAVFRDMKHMGFSDMKFAMKPGYTMGRLDPDKMHVNLCGCMLEMFDAFLKGTKSEPDIKSNNVITVTKYDPDI